MRDVRRVCVINSPMSTQSQCTHIIVTVKRFLEKCQTVAAWTMRRACASAGNAAYMQADARIRPGAFSTRLSPTRAGGGGSRGENPRMPAADWGGAVVEFLAATGFLGGRAGLRRTDVGAGGGRPGGKNLRLEYSSNPVTFDRREESGRGSGNVVRGGEVG